jgi:hypothetical protein
MTATEQREIAAIERARIVTIAARRGLGFSRAQGFRLERLRTLRTLLLLRHEAKTLRAARGEEPEPNRAWYIRQVSRVTWAMDRARP